jgi:lysylphosphatidylglycerol synthetase-like protein (DUF2156 family)
LKQASKIPVERERLYSYYQKYGYSPHGLVALNSGSGWEADGDRGAVSFLEVGRTWLTAEPLAPEEHLAEITREFLAFAAARKCYPVFLPATERFAKIGVGLGLNCVPLGVSPYFDLTQWSAAGQRCRTLRNGHRRAVRAGVTVESAPCDPTRDEIEAVTEAWSRALRNARFGWIFSSDILNFPECRINYAARSASGRLVGMLSAAPIPARNSFYLKDLQRTPDAPSGTSDLLIATALDDLRQRGAQLVTPGAVPLHGLRHPGALLQGEYRLLLHAMNCFRKLGEHIYPFHGLFRFKKRLAPTWWEHEYALAPPRAFGTLRAGWAMGQATAPGGVMRALMGGCVLPVPKTAAES